MTRPAALTSEFLDRAAGVVRRRTGLMFGPARRGAFAAGFVKALAGSPGVSPEGYLDRLDSDPSALDDLVAEITVGETYFLREHGQCAVIRDRILPELLRARPPLQPLRVWSAGCATGEEAYTLAMLVQEAGAPPAHIVGTDICRAALARARRGRYTRWSLRGVAEEVVKTWFQQEGDRFHLRPSLRGSVDFQYLNLAEDVYPSLYSGIWGVDLILCRNVLIYFDAETIARVAGRLIDSLSTDGWLLVGSSDPLLSGLVPCEPVLTAAGLAYRRAGTATPAGLLPAAGPVLDAASSLEFSSLSVGPEPERPPPPAVSVTLTLNAGPPETAREDAGTAFRARDYERAAELAGRAVAEDADALPVWIIRVRALANLGRLPEAGRACAAGLERHQTSAELTYLHAVLLTEGSQYEAAARAARRALYLDRNLVVAHLALARALARLGDVAGARRGLENASRLLSAIDPEAIVPASDGEPAGRLAEMARVQLNLLDEAAA